MSRRKPRFHSYGFTLLLSRLLPHGGRCWFCVLFFTRTLWHDFSDSWIVLISKLFYPARGRSPGADRLRRVVGNGGLDYVHRGLGGW